MVLNWMHLTPSYTSLTPRPRPSNHGDRKGNKMDGCCWIFWNWGAAILQSNENCFSNASFFVSLAVFWMGGRGGRVGVEGGGSQWYFYNPLRGGWRPPFSWEMTSPDSVIFSLFFQFLMQICSSRMFTHTPHIWLYPPPRHFEFLEIILGGRLLLLFCPMTSWCTFTEAT